MNIVIILSLQQLIINLYLYIQIFKHCHWMTRIYLFSILSDIFGILSFLSPLSCRHITAFLIIHIILSQGYIFLSSYVGYRSLVCECEYKKRIFIFILSIFIISISSSIYYSLTKSQYYDGYCYLNPIKLDYIIPLIVLWFLSQMSSSIYYYFIYKGMNERGNNIKSSIRSFIILNIFIYNMTWTLFLLSNLFLFYSKFLYIGREIIYITMYINEVVMFYHLRKIDSRQKKIHNDGFKLVNESPKIKVRVISA